MKTVFIIIFLLSIISCSDKASFTTQNNEQSDNIFSRTFDKDGQLIGFNLFATTCPPTATAGSTYTCAVDSSGSINEFIFIETANTCSWAAADPITLEITGIPGNADIGACDLIFTRIDPSAGFTTFSFVVNVSAGSTFSIANASIDEDSPLTQIRSGADVEALSEGDFEYIIDNVSAASPRCSDNGVLGINENSGAIDFYPFPNYQGICNVSVDIGAETTSFQVTVNNINDAPIISINNESNFVQDQSVSIFPISQDEDADTLTWSTTPSHTCNWLSVNSSTGEVTGTPDDNDVGNCNIGIVANDGTIDSNTIVRSITVENIRPTLIIADVAIDPSAGVVTIIDADIQSNEEGFGTYSLDNVNVPGIKCIDQSLSIAINSTSGTITYDPDPSFSSICHITVVFDDLNSNRNQVRAVFAIDALGNVDPVRNLTISSNAITSITNTPTANWDPPFTFFDHYEVALGTSVGGDEIVTWTDIGFSTSHSFTGLSLSECTPYYISVRVHDIANNTSTIESTPSFVGDITPPTTPAGLSLGNDRFFPDGDANSTSWSSSTDNCGTVNYEVAIGTNISTDNVIAWTSNGSSTSNQFTGFTSTFSVLTDYFNLVRSVDSAGNISAISPSSPWQFPEYAFRRDITFTNPTPEDEFQVEINLDPTNFDDSFLQVDGDDIRFFDTSDTLLEYHVVEFIQGEIFRLIVKIPTSGTDEIYMLYGNTIVPFAGSDNALNSSFTRDLYARISSNGNSPLSAYTYIDNNEIQINGATNFVLAAAGDGVVTSNSNAHTIVQARGPISARVTVNDNDHDILTPISIASTNFANAFSRITDIYEFYNPNSTNATVDIFNYTAAGAFSTSTTINVPAGSFSTTTFNTDNAIIESDIPVVTFSRGVNDAIIFPQTSLEIFGIPGPGYVIFTEDSTTATVYWTDGTTQSISGDRGERITFATTGAQMFGDSFFIIADKPIAGRQTADGDGSEAVSFMPRELLDSKYIVPTSSQYIAIVCHEPGTSIILNDSGSIQNQICPASATHPGRVYFGTTANTVNFGAGTTIESTATFYAAYENGTQQETNLFGASLGIPYSEDSITPIIEMQVNN